MKAFNVGILASVVLLGVLRNSPAQESQRQVGVPYPTASVPRAVDAGALTDRDGTTPISITVALPMRHPEEADELLRSLQTPGDPAFRQFLTAEQFTARFAPTGSEIAEVASALEEYGLHGTPSGATTLKVIGPPGGFERAFSVALHHFEVAAQDHARGYAFHAPLTRPSLPPELAGKGLAVIGLDNRPVLHPHIARPSRMLKKPEANRSGASSTPGNPPGFWTVSDFANYYHVRPLYDRGLSGKGRTIGIMTLASFTPSDAFAYWNDLGLPVDPDRVTIVNVDGGPGSPSDASGSDETTMDVTQAGGVAPGARILVYQAPNSAEGLVDLFEAASEDNAADSLSISWGLWEWFLDQTPVIDPFSGDTVGARQMIHELLVRAAIQGQSVFAASGDSGGYEADRNLLFCYPDRCNLALTVEYPASDPAMTAAGATTLPGSQEFCLNAACTPPYYTIDVPHERVWGDDKLSGLCAAIGLDPLSCGIFPWGSGGGVSFLFRRPFYQEHTAGIERTRPGQDFVYSGTDFGPFEVPMPAHFAGRNVPDVSFNGDPDTGYLGYYTSDVFGFRIGGFWGGTSVVAPQLNGVTALLDEELHTRLGLLNIPLYAFAREGDRRAVVHPIRYGDNWAYDGSNHYNLGVGLGTLDVANFADALRHPF